MNLNLRSAHGQAAVLVLALLGALSFAAGNVLDNPLTYAVYWSLSYNNFSSPEDGCHIRFGKWGLLLPMLTPCAQFRLLLVMIVCDCRTQ